jgi:hypothetical protein
MIGNAVQQQIQQGIANQQKDLAALGVANTPQETATNQIMAQLKAAMSNPSSSVAGTSGSATTPATIAPPTVTPSTSAGQAFAQAKDASSRISNKALDALRSQMVSRGIEGSGVEGQGTVDILSGAQQQQSSAAYDAAKTDEERNWEAANTGYAGAITQRGQDIGLQTAGYQNQYYQAMAQNQQIQMLISLMNGLGGGY